MTITTRLYTFLNGKLIGRDEFGNRYYATRNGKKRWVMYHGRAEPSKVPAQWHGWLHYTLDVPPESNEPRYAWQKPHLPNLTGSVNAYLPSGNIKSGGVRAASTSDYEPWQP